MVDVLERAERVRDAFDRIRQRMREVVHRVDAPGAAGAVMIGVANAVEHRIAHRDVRRSHVDLGAQHVGAVGKFAGAHAAEQIEVLVDAARSVWRVLAWLGQRAAMLADLIGRQRIDVGHALADQILGESVELLVVIRRVVLALVPLKPEPLHVFLDRIDVLDVFLDRIGVVEAEVAVAAELAGDAEVEADRLGVADVQVAVRLRRKARHDPAAVLSGGDVCGDDFANEVRAAASGLPAVFDDPTCVLAIQSIKSIHGNTETRNTEHGFPLGLSKRGSVLQCFRASVFVV